MRFLVVILLLAGPLAYGHARLAANSDITPRNNNPGLKSAPCGNVAKTQTPKTVMAGSTVTLRWEETVNHPGFYQFHFSRDDQNWVELIPKIADQQNNRIQNNNFHRYSTTIKIPDEACDNCTIRLVQEMTDRNPPTFYYSCADIRIVAANNGDQDPKDEEGEPEPPKKKVPADLGGGEDTDCHSK